MDTNFKQKIIAAIQEDASRYTSSAKQATALGISAAQLSRVKNGELEQVLSEAKWLLLARTLGVLSEGQKVWNPAKTPTFVFIYEQLTHCQDNSVSGLFCDSADIGKTFTAKQYVKDHKYAVYIDCSQVKTKQKLIREIAKQFGVPHTAKYADVYTDLMFYLQSVKNPLVILDEGGDLDYPAFLELKALWNATEGQCAYYMMGADGLKSKIENNRSRNKVGYAEIFSRFGSSYQRVSPYGVDELTDFQKTQVAMVVQANMPKQDFQKVFALTNGSLRKTFDYSKKL